MRKLTAFVFTTLNGYYKGEGDNIDWHSNGLEEIEFAQHKLQEGKTLLFGRKTFEMMRNFWVSPMAYELFPTIALRINQTEKLVCSNSLEKTDWNNTTIINGDMIEKLKALKETEGEDITLMGSGSLLSQLAEEDLIDEYELMIDPVLIGKGDTLFDGLTRELHLQMTDARLFRESGTLLLYYKKV
ncbi:dihydrofolate reductase family protein [Mangrovibacterium diazotrophicum]|uniref:Dihydrofolate reductase n=1 Tax=Mangrovibacterium diazotrophicum TaxID=1261403 RepID=A0A419W7A5_9BACT|nr:dihydrofolate reductase family protein [Mangrovibacterium diazotrophicum]RKD91353.1 dihydrofolate reductase [Mangrovibacterium diazotrophicum]